MLEVHHLLENHVFWQISKYSSIKIWEDPWVSNQLTHLLPQPDNAPSECVKVMDLLIQGTSNWNEPLIESIFPSNIADIVKNIYVSEDEKDTHIWTYTQAGKFSTKSCYKIFVNSMSNTLIASAYPWKKLWSKNYIVPKILVFIWKLLHNGLAVKGNLKRINNYMDVSCTFCKHKEETVVHLFFNCPWARTFFLNAHPVISFDDVVMNPRDIIIQWMENNMNDVFMVGVCILWNIWKMRNNLVFSNASFSTGTILKLAFADINVCTQPISSASQPQSSQWIPPEPDFIKVNVDAAFIPNK
ncbi:uncharacterized protein LOC113279021 [Papaver somniferum]|uniref:uncharacterized protein LOC113279021 n=1 Tax=Papaver somniferum TaxID=3469 RepID=UPI000E6FAF00|nr:uncharacterized protein LOC113279021 [Papaver somniferum]